MKVSSLSLGIASFIFIAVYIAEELSYDRFHPHAERIYRVPIDFVDSEGNRLPDATTPPALSPALKNNFDEIEATVRLFPGWGSKYLFSVNPETKFYEQNLLRVDSTFFDVFGFEFLQGDPNQALDMVNAVVLTEETALKYFGRSDVVGENITYHAQEDRPLIVTGVVKSLPANSHFHFDLLSRLTFDGIDTNWGWYNYYTYIKLAPNVERAKFEAKLQPFFEDQIGEREFYNAIYLQPLTDIHLQSDLKWELGSNGSISNVRIFGALALFILIISSLNYLNLVVAASLKRHREVGIRKVFGAFRSSLTTQFLFETLITTGLAFILGILIAQLMLVNASDLLNRQMTLVNQEYWGLLALLGGASLLVGLLAGTYPALHMSSFKPALAVRGLINHSGASVSGLRRFLLVIQFCISALMILGTLVVHKQMDYMGSLDLGLDPEQVLILENADDIANQELLMAELGTLPGVEAVGVSSGIMGALNWTTNIGYPDRFLINYLVVDPGYLETMGFELIHGRNFQKDIETDQEGYTIVVNESAFRELGLDADDIGNAINILQDDTLTIEGKVIGVVKDFHFTDFRMEIKPFVFFYRSEPLDYVNVKVQSPDMFQTLNELEEVWDRFANGAPLEVLFQDETYAALMLSERRLSRIMLALSGLALFIAIMGMFAIANMTIRDRKREIAIRKVLGATATGVSTMVTSRFLMLVLLANLIAAPLGYLAMEYWLDDFVYRTTIDSWVLVVTALFTVIVAWITVGSQSLHAAISNPVKSLREG